MTKLQTWMKANRAETIAAIWVAIIVTVLVVLEIAGLDLAAISKFYFDMANWYGQLGS